MKFYIFYAFHYIVALNSQIISQGFFFLSDPLCQALRALLAMAPMCLTQFRSDDFLLDSLLTLRDQYQDMVQSEMIVGEENGYFLEMLELVTTLQFKIK